MKKISRNSNYLIFILIFFLLLDINSCNFSKNIFPHGKGRWTRRVIREGYKPVYINKLVDLDSLCKYKNGNIEIFYQKEIRNLIKPVVGELSRQKRYIENFLNIESRIKYRVYLIYFEKLPESFIFTGKAEAGTKRYAEIKDVFLLTTTKNEDRIFNIEKNKDFFEALIPGNIHETVEQELIRLIKPCRDPMARWFRDGMADFVSDNYTKCFFKEQYVLGLKLNAEGAREMPNVLNWWNPNSYYIEGKKFSLPENADDFSYYYYSKKKIEFLFNKLGKENFFDWLEDLKHLKYGTNLKILTCLEKYAGEKEINKLFGVQDYKEEVFKINCNAHEKAWGSYINSRKHILYLAVVLIKENKIRESLFFMERALRKNNLSR